MKATRILLVSFMIVLYGIPLPALAQSAPDYFELPSGVSGGPYQANIQTVLREKYHLKLETDIRASVFRWALAGGEIPPGLFLRPNGTIIGSPRVPRDEPYHFQVRVVDAAYAGSEALRIDLILKVAAHQVRLAQIKMPRLTPVRPAEQSDSGSGPAYVSAEEHHAADAYPPARSNAASLISSYDLTTPREIGGSALPRTETVSSNSRPTSTDTSYSASFIRPVLNTLRVAPPDPIPPLIPNSDKKYKVDPSKEKASGDKIRGPAKIELKNLNVLRYDIRVGKDVTFPAAPDLKLPFIPPIPNQPEQLTGATVFIASGDSIDDKFRQLLVKLDPIEGEKTNFVNVVITDAIGTTNTARNSLEALVTASDSILTTGGGPAALVAALPQLIGPGGGGGAGGEIDVALTKVWPDVKIEELLGRLEILRNGLLTLPTTPLDANDTTWDDWYKGGNKAAYDYAVARVSELQNQLNGLKIKSTQGTAFQEAQNKLRRWKPILVGVRDGGIAGFDRVVEVGCGFAFDTGKETKIKIVKRDRLGEPGASPTEEEIVTVVCSSPISVSAGFGFSNIDEKEFVFVPSTKTVTANGQTTQTVISRFGFKNKSAFRTLPVLLLNTRVWEPNDTVALHLSTGAAVDVKTGQGGTDLEYIVGPSISFWRSLFITPGLHIGRVNKLAGGFELDQEVPTGINQPPIEKAWKKGFVTTFTYKIK